MVIGCPLEIQAIGATLLMKAPKAPPTIAAAKAATNITIVTARSQGRLISRGP